MKHPVLSAPSTCRQRLTSVAPNAWTQANGYKNKTMLTRLGEVTFEVPQVRSGGFYPSALERGSRSEQAMNLALAEMYVQGVSTRLRV
jgi:transposase-like protein